MDKKPEFKKNKCESCGQFTNYLLPLDRGTSIIVKAVATAIKLKGINAIHPGKEMEVPGKDWNYSRATTEGKLTSNQIGNFTRARAHGLIARMKDKAGNWCLTTKGAAFLRGEAVPQFAIMGKSKDGARSHKEEYFEPHKYNVTIYELAKQEEFWQAIDFDIVEGQVVKELPKKKTLFS